MMEGVKWRLALLAYGMVAYMCTQVVSKCDFHRLIGIVNSNVTVCHEEDTSRPTELVV